MGALGSGWLSFVALGVVYFRKRGEGGFWLLGYFVHHWLWGCVAFHSSVLFGSGEKLDLGLQQERGEGDVLKMICLQEWKCRTPYISFFTCEFILNSCFFRWSIGSLELQCMGDFGGLHGKHVDAMWRRCALVV